MSNEQQRDFNFNVNEEQQGKFNMNRVLTNRTSTYTGNLTEKTGPKDLRPQYSSKNSKDQLTRLHGERNVQAETRISDEAIENLDGLRTRFVAEIGEFRTEYGYQDIPVRKVLLKDIKMRGFFDKRLRDRLWLTCRKWTQGIGVGDVIEFDARLEEGRLKNPTNVTLINPECRNPKAPVQLVLDLGM